MPIVSVIMPVYNSASFLKEAIESVLNQDFKDFEFLIFNDGSTDESLEIINSYQDNRIKVISNDYNQGYVVLLNEGIRMAKGKYIARMDSDDVAVLNRFSLQVDFLEKNPDYVLCGSQFIEKGTDRISNLPLSNEDIKLKLLNLTPFCHPSIMLRSDVLSVHSISYSLEHMPAEDHAMWVGLARYGKFINLPVALIHYRLHDNNVSLKPRTELQWKKLDEVRCEYIRFFFINVHLDDNEVILMLKLFFKETRFCVNELSQLGDIIQRVITSNAVFPVSTEVVHRHLIDFYFYRCTLSTHIGLESFTMANRFNMAMIKPMRNLRLFIKALIKYNAIK